MVAERLKTLRRERNLTMRKLVDELPINYSTYANYESGFREPNSEILQTLAKHFGVSIDYLLGVSDNRKKAEEIAVLTDQEHDMITSYRLLDQHGSEMVEFVLAKELERVLRQHNQTLETQHSRIQEESIALRVYRQRASAGLGNYLSDDSDDDYELMNFMVTKISKEADFCVRINGPSMEDKICDGDIVFVKATPTVDIGAVGIFMYEGEAYCKRLRVDKKKGTLVLESINKSFAPKHITNPDALHTVGRVIGIAEKPQQGRG